MKIKHSKYRNTGLIYELLVRQITSDLVSRKDSPAVNILRKYYFGENALAKEYSLYKTISESLNMTTVKADALLKAAMTASRKLNQKTLNEIKYKLISEIKDNYNLEEFFSVTVANYKTLAAVYCLMEAERSTDLIDPQSIVNNKITLLESMTSREQDREDVTDSLIREFSSYDKDLRLLTFKVLLEKFNEKYVDLLPEQKNVLKSFMSLGSGKGLRTFINEEILKIQSTLVDYLQKMPQSIERIKLNEAYRELKPVKITDKVNETHLVKVLQFYELINELKNVA